MSFNAIRKIKFLQKKSLNLQYLDIFNVKILETGESYWRDKKLYCISGGREIPIPDTLKKLECYFMAYQLKDKVNSLVQ